MHGSAKNVNPRASELMRLYTLMRRRFGFLDWWPGDTKEEVFIGAILTQQTTWKNVEKAIANLKEAKLLGIKEL
ncbi:HhH-GPD family protein, partial [mine drainage metagenome]